MAVSILGTITATDFPTDGTNRTASHTVTSGTSTLLVAVTTRSFDATNPPAAWTVTYGGNAVTEGLNTFDDTPFGGGRIGVWLGYLHAPTAGTANIVVTTGTTHRGCMVLAWNLAGNQSSGPPFGASASQRYQGSTATSVSLSMTAQATTADNLILSLLSIAQATALTSFDGTGYTDIYTGQYGNFPRGCFRYKLGATGTVSSGATYSGSTTGNIGGALIEILSASTILDDSITDNVSADVTGSFLDPSQLRRTDLAFWNGRNRFTYLEVRKPASSGSDGSFARVGSATESRFISRARVDNGQGSANVYRITYDLSDGQVTADTEAGTQTTAPNVLCAVQRPGDGGKIYLDGEPQANAYKAGTDLTGGLILAGAFEIGDHAAAEPPVAEGLLARILIDGLDWSDAKVEFVSRGILDRRSVYGIGDEETAAGYLAGEKRPPIAMPMLVVAAGVPQLDISPDVLDSDNDGWAVTGVGQGANGTVAKIGEQLVRYTPAAGFQGRDLFTYSIAGNTTGKVSTGQIGVEVTSAGLVVRNNVFSLLQDSSQATIDVLANDTFSGQAVITSVSDPPHGTAAVLAGGTLVGYTPDAGYAGADSFTYTAQAGTQSGTGTVSITVQSNGSTFVTCSDDTATTPRGTALDIPVLANDSSSGPIQVVQTTTPSNNGGQANIPATPNRVRFIPASGFVGQTQFNYTAQLTGGSAQDSATVTVQVTSGPGTVTGWGQGPVTGFAYYLSGRGSILDSAKFSNAQIATALNRPFPDVNDLWCAYIEMPDDVAGGYAWISGADSTGQATNMSHYGGIMTAGIWKEAWQPANLSRRCKLNIPLNCSALSTKSTVADRWKFWFDLAAGIYDVHFNRLGRRMGQRDVAAGVKAGWSSNHFSGGRSTPDGMRILVWGWEINDSQWWSYFAIPSTYAYRGFPIGTNTQTQVQDGLARVVTAFNNGYLAGSGQNCPYFHSIRPTPRCPGNNRLRDILWNWPDASLFKCVGQSQHHTEQACTDSAKRATWFDRVASGKITAEGLDSIGELASNYGWKVWLDETGFHWGGGYAADQAHIRGDLFWRAIDEWFVANPSLAGGVSFYGGSNFNGICNTSLIANPGGAASTYWPQTNTWWLNRYGV